LIKNTNHDALKIKLQRQSVVYTTDYSMLLVSGLIAFICFILFMTYGSANQIFGYNAKDYHWWQLITAHFIHYDIKHLTLNMLALLFLLYLFPTTAKQLIQGFIVAIFFIGIYLFFSDVLFYVGFSGLLYVIPGLALGRFIFEKNYWNAFLIISVYITYSSSIQLTSITSEQIIWTPLLWSHFLGFVAGFMTQTLTNLYDKIKVSVIV